MSRLVSSLIARTSLYTRCARRYTMPSFTSSGKDKVAIIGSGSFGSAMARIVGENCKNYDFTEDDVKMYCFEEEIKVGDGIITFPVNENLTKIINQRRENVKYLPGHDIPDNVTACPDMLTACLDATLLIFVMPFAYLEPLLPTIAKVMHPKARGVSLIKEIHFDPLTLGVKLISKEISKGLTTHHGPFPCGVLMGANVAFEIANGDFSESTLASQFSADGGDDLNEKTRLILNNPDHFRVYHIEDISGCEACGALKNVVAIGAGFIDGLDMGGNTKAALMRIGIAEMERFCNQFLEGIEKETFSESCGMADLITTCIGGRNRKCGEIFARGRRSRQELTWDEIEEKHLNGQRLRGAKTIKQVYDLLASKNLLKSYPLFASIYEIAYNMAPVENIIDGLYIPNNMSRGDRELTGAEEGSEN